MSNGFLVVGPGTVLTSNHVIASRQARDLRRGIEDVRDCATTSPMRTRICQYLQASTPRE